VVLSFDSTLRLSCVGIILKFEDGLYFIFCFPWYHSCVRGLISSVLYSLGNPGVVFKHTFVPMAPRMWYIMVVCHMSTGLLCGITQRACHGQPIGFEVTRVINTAHTAHVCARTVCYKGATTCMNVYMLSTRISTFRAGDSPYHQYVVIASRLQYLRIAVR